MANERKDYVDFLKAIAIFIVILGHVNCANDSVKELIYSFHMPLFFFSTGLLLKDSYDAVLSKGYIRKKIERLIVPYLVWGLIFSDYSRDNLLKIIYGSYKAIKDTNTLSSIWYIPCLILAELMCCYLIKLSFNKKWLLVLYMCALWCAGAFIPDIDGIHNLGYPWQFNIAFTAAGFIMLGKLWDIYLRDFFKKHIMMQITGLIIGVLMLLTYKINLNNCKFVLMASGRYGNYLLFLVAAVGGCLTVLSISMLLSEIKWPELFKKMIVYISSATLGIFLVHKQFIAVFTDITKSIGNDYIRLGVVALATLVCSCIIVALVDSMCPAIIGNKSKKKQV